MKHLAAVALTALLGTTLLGTGTGHAQTEMDHRVQRAWDDVFHPGPPGDPRTNFERRRDYRRHVEYCRYHPGARGCRR